MFSRVFLQYFIKVFQKRRSVYQSETRKTESEKAQFVKKPIQFKALRSQSSVTHSAAKEKEDDAF